MPFRDGVKKTNRFLVEDEGWVGRDTEAAVQHAPFRKPEMLSFMDACHSRWATRSDNPMSEKSLLSLILPR